MSATAFLLSATLAHNWQFIQHHLKEWLPYWMLCLAVGVVGQSFLFFYIRVIAVPSGVISAHAVAPEQTN